MPVKVKTNLESEVSINFSSNLNDLKKSIDDFKDSFKDIKLPKSLDVSLKELETTLKDLEKTLETDPSSKADYKKLKLQIDLVRGSYRNFVNDIKGTKAEDFAGMTEEYQKAFRKIQEIQNRFKIDSSFMKQEGKITAFSDIEKEIDSLGKKAPATFQRLRDALKSGDFNEIVTAFQALEKQVTNGKLIKGYDTITNAIKTLMGQDYSGAGIHTFLEQITDGLTEAEETIKNTTAVAGTYKKEIVENAEGTKKVVDKTTQSILMQGEAFYEAAQEADKFIERLKQFFSITNGIVLLRRAILQAKEAVAELDKSITAIAVVSDYSVKELWNTLPDFTKKAAELGGTISDLYKGTQLWVEQGLEMDVSLRMATEAMKMARVAGISAKDATDALTSALRGFNMEINEMSAQRISDVYSELAKITAADTDEISNAMTKVASLAYSVNMEFENTAAFLSQIIETTRESSETAGTALKLSA